MGRLKSAAAAGLARAGYALYRRPGPGTLERHLRTIFAALEVDCVIDVGANEGQYGALLRDIVGFEGRIASVEPSRAAFERLETASSTDDQWAVFNLALGNENAVAGLHRASIDELSSFHVFSDFGHERYSRVETTTETVQVHRLDAIFDELIAGSKRVFLKSDTQGHDLAVVEGLGDRSVIGLQLELSFIAIYDGTPTAVEVQAAVATLGFGLSGLYPIAEAGFRLIEADGIFVRDDAPTAGPPRTQRPSGTR